MSDRENITLPRELVKAALGAWYFVKRATNDPDATAAITALRAALAAPSEDIDALRRDAERYRWLRVTVYDVSDDRMLRAEELDNAIDAAMEPATEPAIRARGEVPR